MATPFPNVSGFNAEKDAYTFYLSQLRIRIECAFGMLTQRWGFLRKQAAQQHTMTKVIAIMSCLCRIHNFLIDHNGQGSDIPPHTNDDTLTLAIDGAVPMEITPETDIPLPAQLMGGGEHFDDDPDRAIRRRVSRGYKEDELPRGNMMLHVTGQGLRRPVR